MARRATFIQEQRDARGGTLLVLDAGNALIGDREPALSTGGRSSIAAMNTLGYDAMALGLNDVTQLTLHELELCIAEARFAVVSANAVVSATGVLVTEPYAILERDGRRFGILGLTEAGQSAEVRADDPLDAARRWLPGLAEQSDIVILLSHAGADVDRAIAEEFGAVDLVVSGRSGEAYGGGMAGSALLTVPDLATPGDAGTRAGLAELTFSRHDALVLQGWRQVTLGTAYAEDPSVAAWVEQALAEVPPAGP